LCCRLLLLGHHLLLRFLYRGLVLLQSTLLLFKLLSLQLLGMLLLLLK